MNRDVKQLIVDMFDIEKPSQFHCNEKKFFDYISEKGEFYSAAVRTKVYLFLLSGALSELTNEVCKSIVDIVDSGKLSNKGSAHDALSKHMREKGMKDIKDLLDEFPPELELPEFEDTKE